MARRNIGTVALLVRDYDEAKTYYVDVLGFDLVADVQLEGGKRWLLVGPKGSSGARLLLARAEGAAQRARIGDQTGGRVFLFLETDDFWRDHRRLIDKGVRFREAPRLQEYGTVAVFEDLYGNFWDLIQPAT